MTDIEFDDYDYYAEREPLDIEEESTLYTHTEGVIIRPDNTVTLIRLTPNMETVSAVMGGGSLLYRGAVPVANMYTRCVRKRWQTAVDRYIENLPAACAECARTHAALDNSGIEYEIVGKCNWCKKNPADPSPDMDGCCDEDCRYHLARDEGFVTDAEHAANLLEGWVPA